MKYFAIANAANVQVKLKSKFVNHKVKIKFLGQKIGCPSYHSSYVILTEQIVNLTKTHNILQLQASNETHFPIP